MSIDSFFEIAKNDISKQVAEWTELSVEQAAQLVEMRGKGNQDARMSVGSVNRFKKLKGKPATFAAEWAPKFVPTEAVVECHAADAFISWTLNTKALITAVVQTVLTQGLKFGHASEEKAAERSSEKVLVEFSSPNIAKPFHAGHLRSTILGNFLQNGYRALGYDVLSYNYLGDWGKQYGLLAVGFDMFGDEEALKADPIKHLYDVYVRVNAEAAKEGSDINDQAKELFRKMEEGDEAALAVWQRFRDLSIKKYEQIYERLNVRFDVFSGESKHGAGMKRAMELLGERQLLTEEKGCQVVDLPKHGKPKGLGRVIVTKSDGSTLYITRDIAAAAQRYADRNFAKMIYVVGAQQDLHFKQLFALLDLLGYEWAPRCVHVNFGMVKGMSTRKGTAVFLEEILDEAKATMLDVMKKNEDKFHEIDDVEATADLIGLSAVVAQDLSARRHKDYEFQWSRMTAFEGETGPYLQYTHARLSSIGRKTGLTARADVNVDLLLDTPEAGALARELARFPDAVERAVLSHEPNTLLSCLFTIARSANSAVVKLRVKDSEKELADARFAMFDSARIAIASGLRLIGLVPVDKM